MLALVHGRQRLGTKTVGPDLLLLERVWEERVEEDEEVDCAVRRRPTCHGGAGGEDGGAMADRQARSTPRNPDARSG